MTETPPAQHADSHSFHADVFNTSNNSLSKSIPVVTLELYLYFTIGEPSQEAAHIFQSVNLKLSLCSREAHIYYRLMLLLTGWTLAKRLKERMDYYGAQALV